MNHVVSLRQNSLAKLLHFFKSVCTLKDTLIVFITICSYQVSLRVHTTKENALISIFADLLDYTTTAVGSTSAYGILF